MRRTNDPPDIADYVQALLELSGQLRGIVDHMCAYESAGYSSPDALPPAEVLRNLLTETLANVATPRERDIRCATRMLRTTAKTIEREIFLVSPEFEDDEPQR
jgi:hypothetical protein